MTFLLSTVPGYAQAVEAKAVGDWTTARTAFAACLEAARSAGSPPAISGVLFWIGDVEALAGNRASAIARYDEALVADPKSPLALISYAESLSRILREPRLALVKLDAAKALLVSDEWHETADDLSLLQYQMRNAELRREIEGVR